MKILNIFVLFFLSSICYAQINIGYVNEVSEEFIQRYYSQRREYNPLQVGNVWQYYYPQSNFYRVTKVIQDSTINGKRYFKKIYYADYPPTINFVAWERNDTTRSGVTFMLDFEDVNKNGDYSEELPVDSMENPFWSEYTTYKYSFHYPNAFGFFPSEKKVHVKDTNWVQINGDTVISRNFEISRIFWGEIIIEKFGIYSYRMESPSSFCIGAIINGKQYGNIVNIDDYIKQTPSGNILCNNYPNPFNPSTKIKFTVLSASKTQNHNPALNTSLKIYDVLGREVAKLIDEALSPGDYEENFNPGTLASGVYFAILNTGGKVYKQKMMYIK